MHIWQKRFCDIKKSCTFAAQKHQDNPPRIGKKYVSRRNKTTFM